MTAKPTPAETARDTRLARMLSPKSVAILGMSTRPGTAGHMVLRNIQANDFKGEIHLIGRTAGEIEGVRITTEFAALPKGIDVAVLTLPAAGVGEALTACIEREIGTAVVFASGFAEVGGAGQAEQDRIGALVRESGLSVVGPNCIGYSNYRAGFWIGFTNLAKVPTLAPETDDAVAIVAQSGGLASHLRQGLESRGVAVSYNISTGNEMDLSLADFVRYFATDTATRVVLVYAEHIRQPQAFLEAARQVRAAGKVVAMLHPGRSARAQEAAQSHTGALAGDYAVMKTLVEQAGVVLVDSLDEVLDVAELLARYPTPQPGGLGIVTFSGAYCGVAHDFCEDVGIPLPALSEAQTEWLKPQMPPNIEPHNPLDLGTQPLWQPELIGIGMKALLDDPAIAGVAVSIPPGSPASANAYMVHIAAARAATIKPIGLALLGDGNPLPAEFAETGRKNKIVMTRSSDRLLRAMGHLVKRKPATEAAAPKANFASLPALPNGTAPEWQGKSFIAAAGLKTPAGGLARSVEEAVETARKIGFPVVLKAQAAALAHKTEAGGVLLNLGDEAAVRAGWDTLVANVQRAQPGLVLDGMLVETMVGKGLELVLGAKRDPQWGPVVLIGLGGILVEALQDVRLLPADASREDFVEAFGKLKAAKLLKGFRGMPAVDVEAAAEAAWRIGQLMLAQPQIIEIDVNPLMVHATGQGATALDALIVTAAQ